MNRVPALAFAMTALAALTLPASAFAAAEPYEILPNASLVKFESEAPLENITGISTESSGSITVDRLDATRAKGTVRIPVASLRTGNTTRDGHLQGKDWLDAGAHPHISFVLTGVTWSAPGPLEADATRDGTATGNLTIKGKTRAVTVPIKVTWIAANEKLKKAFIDGDVLRVKTQFEVKLADYGVQPPDHLVGVKVAETVTIRASLTAVHGGE